MASAPPINRYVRRNSDLGPVGREFELWLENHGRWVVYVRPDERYQCACYDPDSGAATSPDICPDCFGTGHPVQLTRSKCHVALDVHKTYSSSSGIAPAYMGQVDSTGGLLYLRSGQLPAKFDLVFEVEWDVPFERISTEGTPVRLLQGWQIQKPNPVIAGSQGVVDLWLCGLEVHNDNHDNIQAILRQAGSRILPPQDLLGLTPRQTRNYGGISGNRYPQRDMPQRGTRPIRLPSF